MIVVVTIFFAYLLVCLILYLTRLTDVTERVFNYGLDETGKCAHTHTH